MYFEQTSKCPSFDVQKCHDLHQIYNQQNDTQHNDTQHKDTNNNDIIHYNDTQYKKNCHNELIILPLSIMTLDMMLLSISI